MTILSLSSLKQRKTNKLLRILIGLRVFQGGDTSVFSNYAEPTIPGPTFAHLSSTETVLAVIELRSRKSSLLVKDCDCCFHRPNGLVSAIDLVTAKHRFMWVGGQVLPSRIKPQKRQSGTMKTSKNQNRFVAGLFVYPSLTSFQLVYMCVCRI